MNIEKAIEILEILSDGTVEQIYNERTDALGLGIEALKREKMLRDPSVPSTYDRLPGETED